MQEAGRSCRYGAVRMEDCTDYVLYVLNAPNRVLAATLGSVEFGSWQAIQADQGSWRTREWDQLRKYYLDTREQS